MPSVVLVHGYSETSLAAYQNLPELLSQSGYDTIVLSAFDSLDDLVSIDDLATALEMRVNDLVATGFDLPSSAFVCHSTGALVTRRWILNRRIAGAPLPQRLVTMAGANHGSSLAEIGKTPVGYLEKLLLKHVLSVGKQVLTDLDYGSDFLRKLNEEWLEAWNDPGTPLWKQVLTFSMGGDSIGSPAMKLLWATSESGSDNTVRISGANLNYTILDADPDSTPPSVSARVLNQPVPHLILAGYSHFDTQTGILHATATGDAAFQALLRALSTNADGYPALAAEWKAANDAWIAGKTAANSTADVASTVVFNLSDQFGSPISDCMIAFWDQAIIPDPQSVTVPPSRPAGAPFVPPAAEPPEVAAERQSILDASLSSADSILPNSPLHNNVAAGSYSFYLSYPVWVGDGTRHHAVYIEAVSDSPNILYKPTIYQPSADIGRLIQPNQFTYVNVTLNRDPDAEYAMYKWSSTDLGPGQRQNAGWRPFPDLPSRIPPRA